MKLQGIIAKASKDRINIEGFASHEEMADAILSALTASGYRILGPGEMDAETIEAAATVASKYCWNRYREGGKLKTPAVFTSHTRDDLAYAIRALKDKRDG